VGFQKRKTRLIFVSKAKAYGLGMALDMDVARKGLLAVLKC
jgi:hypothetical protein